MFAKRFQLATDGGAMTIEPPAHLGMAELAHLLMEDADAFLSGKQGVGHRRLGLSMVVSW